MLKVPPLNLVQQMLVKKKFQVAGRTTFCQLFCFNHYITGAQKLPVAGPKNMYN